MIGDILQPSHLLFILVVALLVLGPKRLPEVGRALGRGMRDFRSALNTDELHEQMLSTTSDNATTPFEQEPRAPTEAPADSAPTETSLAAQPDLSATATREATATPEPTATAEPEQPDSPQETAPEPEPAASAPAPDRVS